MYQKHLSERRIPFLWVPRTCIYLLWRNSMKEKYFYGYPCMLHLLGDIWPMTIYLFNSSCKCKKSSLIFLKKKNKEIREILKYIVHVLSVYTQLFLYVHVTCKEPSKICNMTFWSFYFSEKIGIDISWNVKTCFLWKMKKEIKIDVSCSFDQRFYG